MADDRISYAPTDGLSLRSRGAEVLGPQAALQQGDHPGLRGLSRLPHVLQVLRRLPEPVRVHRQAARRQGAGADRGRDRAGDGRLLPVQAVRGAVPYTPRDNHPFQLDFPKLVHRFKAVRAREQGVSLRDKFLGDPDAAGKAARLSGGLANKMNRVKAHRWFMEKTLGIHRDKLLPAVRRADVRGMGRRAGPGEGGARRRGGAVPDLLRAEQRAGDRPGHRRGAAEEPGGRALRARPGLLRDARLGERQPARAAEAGPAQPGRADAVRGQGRQGAGHQPHLLDDVAAGVPDAGGGGGSPAGARSWPRRCAIPASTCGRCGRSRASTPTSSPTRRRSPTTPPATCARRRSASAAAISSARPGWGTSPSWPSAAATTAPTP